MVPLLGPRRGAQSQETPQDRPQSDQAPPTGNCLAANREPGDALGRSGIRPTRQVRLNDFPRAYMYTLIIAGEIIGDFNNWPERGIVAKRSREFALRLRR